MNREKNGYDIFKNGQALSRAEQLTQIVLASSGLSDLNLGGANRDCYHGIVS